MRLFGSEPNSREPLQYKINMEHLEGLEGFSCHDPFFLELVPETGKLLMQCRKKRQFLALDQIRRVRLVTWQKTLDEEANPSIADFLGGALGVSSKEFAGISGKKTEKVENALALLCCPPGRPSELHRVIFSQPEGGTYQTQWFAQALCLHAGLPGPEREIPL